MKKFFNLLSSIIMIIILIFLVIILFENIFFDSNIEDDYNIENNMQKSNIENNIEKNVNNDVSQIQDSTVNSISSKKFYYSQLDDSGKIIYNVIMQNKENLKTGTYQIKFDNQFDEVLSQENGQDIVIAAFHSAWTAYIYDNPEFFYIDITKINLSIETSKRLFKTTYSVIMEPIEGESYLAEFNTGDDVSTVLTKVQSQRNQIIADLSGTDYNKVRQVHDWLVNNVQYEENEDVNRYDIFGALINKSAVCEGYAEALKYILDEVGIECIIVSGTGTNSNGATEAHEWNYVKLDNKWYGVDITWDDPIIIGGGTLSNSEKYTYLCKGSNVFDKNHFPDGKIAEKGMEFKLPQLNETDFEY